MQSRRPISRRTFVVGGAASATLAAAGIRRLTGDAAAAEAKRTLDSCACPSTSASRRSGPTLLRYAKQEANIPTPREQTVIVEQTPTNVWDSFNPYIPNGEVSHYGLHQGCRECMFYANFEQGEIIPWLATKYEYNPDFTQITLSLNPAATWNDGRPYTADDVVFSLDLLKANGNFSGADQVSTYVASATAADPNTVVIALTEPNPRFHYNFISGIYSDVIRVVPKHVWETQDAGTFKNNPPVFTGPYVLDRVIADQFMYVWKKNPTYWNKANLDPKPEYYIVRQALPADAAVQEFTRGNIDVPGIDYLAQEAVEATYENMIQYQFADPCPRGVWMNQDSPSGLFQTAEGRWAISYLLDRETIAGTIWQPPSRPAIYPWADWGANDKWTAPDIQEQYNLIFDPARAEQLLDQIGATRDGDLRSLNGQPLRLRIVTPVAVGGAEHQTALTIAENAREVGIEMEVVSLQGSAWDDTWSLGDFDLTSHWLCGAALDPGELYTKFLERQYRPIGERAINDRNNTRTRIPELNDIALQLEAVNPDDPANKPLFDQGLEAYLKHLPAAPVIQTIYPFAFDTTYWTGWPTEENRYNIAANWWAQFIFVLGALQPAGQ